ncbi:autotransporter strand-loop-strand O-heptosyltransferase [Burkholderia sp. L27(2015)]|uniref:autotransporter strand-loop-strand O-heptosyltransferase n=1 Tax=Burkholderia sp. L27(2015) TaxID=1641858 RepID=UPI00131D6A1C|nr:autotransporter strand-loop-strand O-heptosyltransferase [Burkholderia sp. L27(2015)]
MNQPIATDTAPADLACPPAMAEPLLQLPLHSPATACACGSSEPDTTVARGGTDAQDKPVPTVSHGYRIDPGPVEFAVPGTQIRYDFHYGARVQVGSDLVRVRLIDLDDDVTLYDDQGQNVLVTSTKRYYVRFRIEVLRDGKLLFEHNYDARHRNVLIKLPVGTLGDALAWFPYAEEFRRKHDCKLYCAVAPEIAELFKASYPEINFVLPEAQVAECYATYHLGIFFPCDDRAHQPVDFRVVGLHKTVGYLLGVTPAEIKPIAKVSDPRRRIAEPYVCIAAQASTQCKYWNHPTGWLETVKFLKQLGYRVLCIDKQPAHGHGLSWNLIPYGAEDFTGDLSLQERASVLLHADFFVGLSSGLSWLACAVGTPVVMISGFTHPINEFATPYRVINYHVCNSCWNDTRIEFVHDDFMWCPRHKGTERQFECSRFITPGQVKAAIQQLLADRRDRLASQAARASR